MKILSLVLGFAVLTSLAAAQKPDAAAAGKTTANPVSTSLQMLLGRNSKNTISALEAMPADKFSYKPTPEQITFAHLAAHMVEANNLLCSKAADVPEPKNGEVKDTDPKDKLVSAVKDSFAFCETALAKMDDSKLGDNVELFGGRVLPRAAAALSLAGAWNDHYATAAMYLRLNGITPPSAAKK